MSKKPDGGGAFPSTEFYDERPIGQSGGMSIRDYFAAKFAHAEMVTAGMSPEPAQALAEAADKAGRTIEQQVSFNAYKLADAMIAERSKA